MNPARKLYSRLPIAVAGVVALMALGCGDEKSGRLVDFLDELEFDVPLETAAYVPIGRYDVPIAAEHDSPLASKYMQQFDDRGTVWLRLQFELMAETTPHHEKALNRAVAEHQGALNDAVLTIVRTSTVEELADPRLAAVHARITEAVQPLLGEKRIRQLVFNDPQSVAERERREHEKKAKSHGGHGGGHGAGHEEHGGQHEESGEDHGEDHGQEHDSHGEAAHGSDSGAGDPHDEQEHGSDEHGDH